MKKVIMLRGLPASGKTTFARELVKQGSGNVVRVNKDDLRAMLHNSKHSRNREQFVLAVRDFIVENALTNDKTVVVDDTNFNPVHEKRLRELAEKHGAAFEIIDIETPISECIQRDQKRENSVGAKVILDMANRYNVGPSGKIRPPRPTYNPGLKDAIVCDIDGTLALITKRNPYDTAKCYSDEPNEPVIQVLKRFVNDHDIILVSGREEAYRELTEQWLHDNDVPFNKLYMRPTGNNEKDAIIKKRIYEDHIKGKYNIRFVIDDRKQVVAMWRDELGLPVFQVDWGEF